MDTRVSRDSVVGRGLTVPSSPGVEAVGAYARRMRRKVVEIVSSCRGARRLISSEEGKMGADTGYELCVVEVSGIRRHAATPIFLCSVLREPGPGFDVEGRLGRGGAEEHPPGSHGSSNFAALALHTPSDPRTRRETLGRDPPTSLATVERQNGQHGLDRLSCQLYWRLA